METQLQKETSHQTNILDRLLSLKGRATLLLCGGLAGCLAKTTVAPLDRVKILLQTHNQAHDSHGIFSTLRHVWSVEGLSGLYRSNGVQMIRIFPYSAIQFLAFDVYNSNLSALLGNGNLTRLFSGSMAGMTAVTLTYPLDVVRTRLAYQSAASPPAGANYSGIADCLRHLRSQRALFAGLGPSLAGMAPYAGVSFCAYHWLQRQAVERWPGLFASVGATDDEPSRLRAWARPLIGGLAGAAAQTVSYPLDCARRSMQVAGAPGRLNIASGLSTPAPAGAAATLSELYSRYGVVSGLYRGLSLNYLRVVPTAGVSFAAYETLRQAFGV